MQFLNACFGASNTDARRLHSLTDSVLIFDEIQSLPAHCKTLFERTITFLAVCCGATVVLCTATQPQLELSCPSAELMSDYDGLSRDMRRVSYIPQFDRPMHNSEAAAKLAEMLKSHSVLTIVNTKPTAHDIYTKTAAMLSESGLCPVFADISSTPEQLSALARQNGPADILCIHLSTSLCPAHRKLLLRWVKLWLREKARVFCISTSLIEAGINVSFPVVVRSLAGLPSIVQAAESASDFMQAIVMVVVLVAVLTLGVASAGGLNAVFENVKDFPGFLEFFGIADPVTEGGVQLAVNGVPSYPRVMLISRSSIRAALSRTAARQRSAV